MNINLKLIAFLALQWSGIAMAWAQPLADSLTAAWYPFEKYYIDLKTLHRLETVATVNRMFKNSQPYTLYFKGLSIDKLAYRGRFFEITPNNGLKMINLRTDEEQILPNPDEQAERYGQHFLMEVADGVVYIKHLGAEIGFKIYKYSPAGEMVFSIKLPHTDKVKKEHLEYFRPYLQYLTHTTHQLVFTSYEKSKPLTYLIDAIDGRITELAFSTQGVVCDEANRRDIIAFLHAQQDSLMVNYLNRDFFIKKDFLRACNSFEAVQRGTTLVIAAYNRTAAGAYLLGLDANTGQELWQTRVEPFQANGNATYYNKIWLSHYGNYALLEGMEAGGRYLQIFDIQTGKRLY